MARVTPGADRAGAQALEQLGGKWQVAGAEGGIADSLDPGGELPAHGSVEILEIRQVASVQRGQIALGLCRRRAASLEQVDEEAPPAGSDERHQPNARVGADHELVDERSRSSATAPSGP